MNKLIQNVPTHLFLGFLSVGKTSTILNLFKQKPKNERWAVLVNEFGKLGIDGKIYESKDILVKEVPGGCLCCVVGLPFQVAINQILKEQNPDRLFIESSGASHTEGVINTLTDDQFKTVLDLKATLCIITPKHLNDKRYRDNMNYRAQLKAADAFIVNKMDQATATERLKLDDFIKSLPEPKPFIQLTSFGDIDCQCFDAPKLLKTVTPRFFNATNSPISVKSFSNRFPNHQLFNHDALSLWMQQDHFIRAKGIVHTDQGWFSFNVVNSDIQIEAIQHQEKTEIDIVLDQEDEMSDELLTTQLHQLIKNH